MNMNGQSGTTTDVAAPVRNRYFYGKLLDVFHFEMEQNYFNTKRWLLNRVVTGYGVICGLQVILTPDGKSVYVTPGIALDKCGREIIVCQQSEPCLLPQPTAPPPPAPTTTTTTPPAEGTPTAPSNPGTSSQPPVTSTAQQTTNPSGMSGECSDTGNWCHLAICYHECPTDPSPALGGDCDTQSTCSPGAIRERYCLKICDNKQCPPSTTSNLQPMISGGVLNYAMLATYVSNQKCCTPPIDDCCIPLANIQIPASPNLYTANSIDINIRPLVYTNDMLYDLMLAWMNQGQPQTRGTK
jgi:hypothetical protein